MKIILIGFMGSGKSAVAKRLGERLALPVLEMDTLVLQKTGCQTMHEVFAKGGELLLRETEIAIARQYAVSDHLIISTGGGVVLNKINLDYLKQKGGRVIFLNAPFPLLAARLAGQEERPLFKNLTEAESLYVLRQPLYLTYADHTVDVAGKSVDEIVKELSDGQ